MISASLVHAVDQNMSILLVSTFNLQHTDGIVMHELH